MSSEKIRPGLRVRVKTRTGLVLEGLVLPRYELYGKDHVTLKLDNGYNVGIRVDNIVKVEVLGKPGGRGRSEGEIVPERAKEKPGVEKRVFILGTGGTIASKIDYETGGVKPTLTTEDLLEAVPEIADICRIQTELLFNVFSEDLKPSHWSQIAERVASLLKEDPERGVIIAHGTDTMSYTASALSFALRRLPAPIALVGAQRSSDRPSSDSAMNLVAAALYATSGIGEVAIVMHGETGDTYALAHRGTRVRKMHTSRRDAFQSIDSLPLAKILPEKKQVVILRSDARRVCRDCEPIVMTKFSDRVALVKFYPGMKPSIIDHLVDDGYLGIVLEGTGLGHVANDLIPSIRRGVKSGVVFTMTSQCLFGTVNMNVYSTGRKLLEAGVIPSGDMLPETAFVKLSWLLGNYDDLDEVKRLYTTNLVGEMEERRRVDLFPGWKHEP